MFWKMERTPLPELYLSQLGPTAELWAQLGWWDHPHPNRQPHRCPSMWMRAAAEHSLLHWHEVVTFLFLFLSWLVLSLPCACSCPRCGTAISQNQLEIWWMTGGGRGSRTPRGTSGLVLPSISYPFSPVLAGHPNPPHPPAMLEFSGQWWILNLPAAGWAPSPFTGEKEAIMVHLSYPLAT